MIKGNAGQLPKLTPNRNMQSRILSEKRILWNILIQALRTVIYSNVENVESEVREKSR